MVLKNSSWFHLVRCQLKNERLPLFLVDIDLYSHEHILKQSFISCKIKFSLDSYIRNLNISALVHFSYCAISWGVFWKQ